MADIIPNTTSRYEARPVKVNGMMLRFEPTPSEPTKIQDLVSNPTYNLKEGPLYLAHSSDTIKTTLRPS